MLNREQILAATPHVKEVAVPEWGGSVYIRPLTLAEQARLGDLSSKFEKSNNADRLKNGTLLIVQWCVCDGDGNQLFRPDDMPAMLGKSGSAFLRLQDEILAFSGLTRESREELEKNLPISLESATA